MDFLFGARHLFHAACVRKLTVIFPEFHAEMFIAAVVAVNLRLVVLDVFPLSQLNFTASNISFVKLGFTDRLHEGKAVSIRQ